jgi:hypothetical protein
VLLLTIVAFQALTSAALGTVTIESQVPCPSADALAMALRPMINALPPDWRRLVILPAEDDSVLLIRLETAAGAKLAERRWNRGAEECAAVTEEVAVLAATWLTRVATEGTPPLGLAPAGGRGAAENTGPAHRQPAAPSAAPVAPAGRLSVGIAAGLALASGGAETPAAMLEVRNGFASRPAFSLAVEVFGTGRSTEPLAPGEATWRRVGGALKVGGRTPTGRLAAAVDLGVAGSALFISGSGFPVSSSGTRAEIGVVAEARAVASPFGGGWAPRLCLGLRLAAGAPHYNFLVDGPPDTRRSIPWLLWVPFLGVEFPWPG